MWQQQKFIVQDHSHVGEVRRHCTAIARDIVFSETLRGKVSIVSTELATNIVKHAGSGEIIVTRAGNTLHIVALDKGKGMDNVLQCLSDGYSSGGTAGTGLGSIKRNAQFFDIFTAVGKGTAVYAGFHEQTGKIKVNYGAVSIPYKDELVCGDGWSVASNNKRFMVADGLGHGMFAHEASLVAQQIFKDNQDISLDELMQRLHVGLRSTRGAAISIAEIDSEKGVLNFCGIGNVSGVIHNPGSVKRCISYNGTIGAQIRKVQTLPYPMNAENGLFFMSSDGLSNHWLLKDYPGLSQMNPYIIAGVLYRDHGRSTDDVTVLVVKGSS
ncbi:MAG TPA: ATP-binding SpoIIE family protein phosphatase [Bacteriovoracaceae bacterium]|nr:ATP-binding SpoIIE family protein phosphatase [Bacteriovoracaceae bacterium]